ncbi:hypothetical protein QOT17_005318 [Balamuthia mandrillaris]
MDPYCVCSRVVFQLRPHVLHNILNQPNPQLLPAPDMQQLIPGAGQPILPRPVIEEEPNQRGRVSEGGVRCGGGEGGDSGEGGASSSSDGSFGSDRAEESLHRRGLNEEEVDVQEMRDHHVEETKGDVRPKDKGKEKEDDYEQRLHHRASSSSSSSSSSSRPSVTRLRRTVATNQRQPQQAIAAASPIDENPLRIVSTFDKVILFLAMLILAVIVHKVGFAFQSPDINRFLPILLRVTDNHHLTVK